jgi:hypothetical protein
LTILPGSALQFLGLTPGNVTGTAGKPATVTGTTDLQAASKAPGGLSPLLDQLSLTFQTDDGGPFTVFFDKPATPGDVARAVLAAAKRYPAVSLAFGADLDHARRGRFLDHLLARYGEGIDDHGTSKVEDLIRAKQALLAGYPWLGGARGTGFDCLRATGADNRSGLEARVRLKLGLQGDEDCVVVEHILLRPMDSDLQTKDQLKQLGETQQVPLMGAAVSGDPYSLQLTFVFKDGVGRFVDNDTTGIKALAVATLRAETPAHITPQVIWLKDTASSTPWSDFVAAHNDWLAQRRTYLAGFFNIDLTKTGS